MGACRCGKDGHGCVCVREVVRGKRQKVKEEVLCSARITFEDVTDWLPRVCFLSGKGKRRNNLTNNLSYYPLILAGGYTQTQLNKVGESIFSTSSALIWIT